MYVKGNPFSKTNNEVDDPITAPDFPLINSGTSGFFFCGIIDDPVQNASSMSTSFI